MRVLMFSWEYPPHVVGGLGKHVAEILPPLGNLENLEVHLVAPRWGGGAARETVGGATVHRVDPPITEGDFYTGAWQTNLRLEEYGRTLWQESGPFDLIHVHDWLVAFVGAAFKRNYAVPLVSTIHATEQGRGRGSLGSDQARAIHHVEWWLTYESWRVIACSEYMADEIVDYFSCPRDKIDVIPNGVDTERFDRLDGLQDLALFRNMYALPFEQIVFSVGRIVYEKGLHLLIDAMPAILAQHPTAKIVIAGKGPELDALRSQAWRVGVGEKILLTGFITDEDRDKLFKIANCAVFPSIYEPFGIVALEAMAARCPVVVTEVGGLKDVVLHNETGIVVYPNNPDSLAWGVVHTLKHPEWSRNRVANAYEVVRTRYNWEHIARDTARVYRQVVAERAVSNW
ncbi:MAG: glycosyltransferase family 4 protein [Anaerolineaceae bacterium]|nr:glycosyltransferase family 4 protein [Anaerolineaceae bacterium]